MTEKRLQDIIIVAIEFWRRVTVNNENNYYPNVSVEGNLPSYNTPYDGAVIGDKKQKTKKSKRVLLILICLLVGVIFGFLKEQSRQTEEWMAQEWFIFSDELDSNENVEYLTKEELTEYKPKREIYNSEYYFGKLTDNEKLIYKAYLYALDNNFVYTYIDESFVTGNYSALDILVMLSLDSGFIQQNLSSVEYDSTQTLTKNIMFKNVTKEMTGFTVSAQNFSKARVEKTTKAVEILSDVNLKFEKNATEQEKAKVIYDYVHKNVDYAKKYDNNKNISADTDYLYEAVFDGESNCDGFSNMFSILCHIYGIECFEKNSVDKKGEVGHTWNTVCLDGKWYNMDCTETVDSSAEDEKIINDLFFGFPDSLQQYETKFFDLLPKCEKNITPIKKTLSNTGSEAVNFFVAELRENKGEPAIALIKSASEKDVDNLAQSVVNRLYGTVNYNSYKVEGGRIVWIKKG